MSETNDPWAEHAGAAGSGGVAVKRIGLYGGTFDPPHLAHLVVADRAIEVLSLDELIVMPCGTPPLKASPGATPEQRLEMAGLAFDRPDCTVSDLEVRRPGRSYTVDTLQQLLEERPPADWWLVVGADALADFGRWREPDRIVRLARLAVAQRPGTDLATALAELPEAARQRVDAVPVPRLDIASSDLRRAFATGLSARYLVPDPVRALVAKLCLYRDA